MNIQAVWGPALALPTIWPPADTSCQREGLYRSLRLAENEILAMRLRFWKALDGESQAIRQDRDTSGGGGPDPPTQTWRKEDWKATPILVQGKWVGVVDAAGRRKWNATAPRPGQQDRLWIPVSRRDLSRALKLEWGVAPEALTSEDSASESSIDRVNSGTGGRGGRRREKGAGTETIDRLAKLEEEVKRLTQALIVQTTLNRPPPGGGLG